MSTAYYAVFHTLASDAADMVVGSSRAARNSPAWRQAYRALQHSRVRDVCKIDASKRHKEAFAKFPNEIQDFGNAFIALQAKRHSADYDPAPNNFSRNAVIATIEEARGAIEAYKTALKPDRRAFSVFVLMELRPDSVKS